MSAPPRVFRGVNPATGQELDPPYQDAAPAEVDRALVAADSAFETYRNTLPADVARFLGSGAAAEDQGFPSAALPPELQDANPRGIWRLLDGEWTRAAVAPAAG